mmetsp:Transcript_7125/g.8195  ORF Transcript_7125/g.8195 Transcript_7125/m.8195 type:complete len:87 (+) Transcript_7125:1890-2150(+)
MTSWRQKQGWWRKKTRLRGLGHCMEIASLHARAFLGGKCLRRLKKIPKIYVQGGCISKKKYVVIVFAVLAIGCAIFHVIHVIECAK